MSEISPFQGEIEEVEQWNSAMDALREQMSEVAIKRARSMQKLVNVAGGTKAAKALGVSRASVYKSLEHLKVTT